MESWKEIASYLNRSERTVRRWEEKEGLPVHRQQHDKRGTVYGYTWELDTWRESRRQLMEAEPAEAPAPPVAHRHAWRLAAATALVVVASVGGFWFLARPSPSVSKRTPNPEAVRLVQLGQFSNAGRVQIQTGIRHYQDAISLDPGYAPAWSGLAIAHLVLVWFGEASPADAIAQAKSEAREAIRLDPSLNSPGRLLAGISHFFEWNHATAEQQFRRAIELGPQDAVALSWFGDFLLDMRRFDEARMAYRRAQEVNPRWLEPIAFTGNTYLFTGNADLAIVEYRRALESEPNYGLANHYLGRAYLAKGEYEKGIAQLRKSNELLGGGSFPLGDLGYGLAIGGKRAEAEALLSDLIGRRGRGYYPAFPIAQIYLGLGDTDAALDWLERAADEHYIGFYMPSVDSIFDPVRSHPRFKAVMERAHLPH